MGPRIILRGAIPIDSNIGGPGHRPLRGEFVPRFGLCCLLPLFLRAKLVLVVSSVLALWCDNESAIKIYINPVQHFNTKHIEIRYHFIWGRIRRGEIELNYVNTHDNLADIFTKPLDEARFRELRHELNIIDSSNVA